MILELDKIIMFLGKRRKIGTQTLLRKIDEKKC